DADSGRDEDTSRALARLAARREVACVFVYDRLESALPSSGHYRVSDGERVLELPTGSKRWHAEYAARFAERRGRLETLCRRNGMRFVALETGADVAAALRE